MVYNKTKRNIYKEILFRITNNTYQGVSIFDIANAFSKDKFVKCASDVPL